MLYFFVSTSFFFSRGGEERVVVNTLSIDSRRTRIKSTTTNTTAKRIIICYRNRWITNFLKIFWVYFFTAFENITTRSEVFPKPKGCITDVSRRTTICKITGINSQKCKYIIFCQINAVSILYCCFI